MNTVTERAASHPHVEIDGFSIGYAGSAGMTPAVIDVSLTINRGEFFGLAGESGCGKSTLANALLRLTAPPAYVTAGTIRVGGQDLMAMSPGEVRKYRWAKTAMVFQSAMNALNPVITIGEQIEDVLKTHGFGNRDAIRARRDEVLRLVDLDPAVARTYAHKLSGGMKQRVVIAIAMALQPELLVMDEPTTALDVVVQQEILDRVKELQREFGFTVLLITHDISLMVEMSDRMAIMRNGRIVELGETASLYLDSEEPYTRQLIDAFPPITGPRAAIDALRRPAGKGATR